MAKEKPAACGFEHWLPCTTACKYYKTCTRNPNNKEKKNGKRTL